MLKEDYGDLGNQLAHAKTKEEFVAIGMQLFQTPAFKKKQEDVLSKEWERRQNEVSTKQRWKKRIVWVCQEFCVNHFSVCRIIVFHEFRHTLIHQQLVANERPVWYPAP